MPPMTSQPALQTAVFPRLLFGRQLIPSLILILILLAAFIGLSTTQPALAAVDCNDTAWQIGDEADLNDAIACYSAKPEGNYSITFTQNISLTVSSTIIDNATAGATLLVDGDGFTVDGQDIWLVQPFQIATDTTATIQNITITGGFTHPNGGGLYNHGTLAVNNSIISGNSGSYGGGIHNTGTLTVTDSMVSDNSGSNGAGGGVYNDNGTLTIDNSTISDNSHSDGSGGGIYNNNGTLTVTNSNISGNFSTYDGGGISNFNSTLTLSNSTVSDNSSFNGGGIYNRFDTATVINSSISDNSASSSGGGIANGGGGILSVTSSTLNGNSANIGGGISNSNTVTVTNSTLSGNSVSNSGGGVRNDGTISVSNSTLSNNSSSNIGGGIDNHGTLTIDNTIIANSTRGDCLPNFGTVNDNGRNLIEDTGANACSLTHGTNNNIIGQDPNLGPLQDNGGPATSSGQATLTHALLTGSPAIDTGDSTLTNDQRSVGRPQGVADDIGAFEWTASDCSSQLWQVGTANELNAAIICFNIQTAANSYTISVTQNISLTASTPAINNNTPTMNLTIDGNNNVVDGQDMAGVRPFEISIDNNVTMQHITITRGDSGGISNSGTLTLTNSTISDNSAGSGGGIFNSGSLTVNNSTISGNSAGSDGGGIFNSFGGVILNNSTISGNSANDEGGGIYSIASSLSVNSSTLSGNTAVSSGGGIFINFGAPTLNNSIIANSGNGDCVTNAAPIDEGYNLIEDTGANACGLTDGTNNNIIGQDPILGPLQDNVGPTFTHALLDGSPAIDAGNSTTTTDQRGVTRPQGNAADIGAFELYDHSGQLWLANTAGDLDAAIAWFNVQTVANSYTISITQNISLTTSLTPISNSTPNMSLTIEGNDNTVDGQAVLGIRPFAIAANTAVTIQNITITGGNVSDNGGGITNNGTLTISNSTINGNSAASGGGIFNNVSTFTLSNNSTIISDDSGTLTINNSTISSNLANAGGGGIRNNGIVAINNSTISNNSTTIGGGSGVYNDIGSAAAITNSTISGNSANSSGGIYNLGTLTLASSTVNNNSATSGGGIFNAFGGTLTIANNIIANSTNGDCVNSNGTITDNGHNLIEETGANACGLTDGTNNNIIGQAPLLGPLQNNDGSTFTHALLDGSPAIDAGNSSEAIDQRGIDRPQGGVDDIGAYELIPNSYNIFLPFVVKPGYPDLVAESITVIGDADVEIVIRNSGTVAVTAEFWVDLYIGLKNSSNPPTQVDDIWQNFSPNGAAWLVSTSALPLNVGDTLTLTINDAYFNASYSNIGSSIADSMDMYVQVDSANVGNSNGSVLESHEQDGGAYNNVLGPVSR